MSNFSHPQESFLESEIEPRTSIMAVVSFVCSLICCIPILTGMLGAFLGVIALFLIGNSKGRLKGRGLAFAGVALGLLSSLAWIGLAMGMVRFLGGTVNHGTTAFEAIDAGEVDDARAVFMPSLDQSISDEQIEIFGAMVSEDYGAFVAGPKSFWEYFSFLRRAGQSGFAPGGQVGEMPIALEYENGIMLATMGMPMGSAQPAPGRIIRDLSYQRPDGTIIWLSEIEVDADDGEPTPDGDGSGDAGQGEGG